MSDEAKEGTLVWITCIECKNNTEHTIQKLFKRKGKEPISWRTNYEILNCNGCKTVTFRVAAGDEETINEDGYYDVYTFYPSRQTGRQSVFGHMRLRNPAISPEIHKAYEETIAAVNNSLPLLAAVGIRLIIEALCRKEKCEAYCKKYDMIPSGLKNQINALVAKGIITAKQAKVLHKPRFLGNSAAHEILPPTEQEIIAALEITELMLRTIYTLDSLGGRILSIERNEKKEARQDKKVAKAKAAKAERKALQEQQRLLKAAAKQAKANAPKPTP